MTILSKLEDTRERLFLLYEARDNGQPEVQSQIKNLEYKLQVYDKAMSHINRIKNKHNSKYGM
jgi:hypothetical protein